MATPLKTGAPAPTNPPPGMVNNSGLTPVPGGGYRLQPGPGMPGAAPVAPGGRTPAPGTPGGPAGVGTATVTAQDDPKLTALNDRYNKYLDSYEGGTGSAMDLAAGRMRDSREGGRAAMSNDAAFRGVGADTGKYDATTQRGQQAAIANVAAQREAAQGENLRGGLGIAGATGEANRADRGQNMDLMRMNQQQGQQQWENQRSQANDEFSQFLALLGQARQGPLPPGMTMPTQPGQNAPAAPTGPVDAFSGKPLINKPRF